MVTSPYEWKIKLETNKQTNEERKTNVGKFKSILQFLEMTGNV